MMLDRDSHRKYGTGKQKCRGNSDANHHKDPTVSHCLFLLQESNPRLEMMLHMPACVSMGPTPADLHPTPGRSGHSRPVNSTLRGLHAVPHAKQDGLATLRPLRRCN